MKHLYLKGKLIALAIGLNILYFSTAFSQATNKYPQFCEPINDEIATTQLKSDTNKAAANYCGKYYVNVFFHFIRDNNGATGEPVSNVNQYMTILNNAFNAHNIFFANKGFDQINNSTLAAIDYDHMNRPNLDALNHGWKSNAINIYIFRSDKNSNISGGIAYRPGTKVAIGGGDFWVSNYDLSNVLSHEVGHALNLYHTHNGTDGGAGCAENPNGSNGATCGDLVADTPADPKINGLNWGDCTNPYTTTYNNIIYNPDPRNIMSYATKNCLSLFTPGQGARMQNALETLSILQPIQELSISGPSLVCASSANYSLTSISSSRSISWTTNHSSGYSNS